LQVVPAAALEDDVLRSVLSPERIDANRGVQADTGIEDEPAIALYSKLGRREDVLHFDIAVDGVSGAA